MIVTSENAGDVMVERTYLRKVAVSGEPLVDMRLIDDAGIASVRSDLFRDRSKSGRLASLAARTLARVHTPLKGSRSPSVGYNITVSNVPAQASSRSRIPPTPRRFMQRNRIPPNKSIISFKRSTPVRHVTVSPPRSGGAKGGMSVGSFSSPF